MKKLILMITLIAGIHASAQTQSTSMPNFRRNFAIIAFAGLGGAVLGLSTLSFYGVPQDHVGNITTGFLIGVVGGGVYVASEMTPSRTRSSEDSFSLIDNRQAKMIPRLASTISLPLLITDF